MVSLNPFQQTSIECLISVLPTLDMGLKITFPQLAQGQTSKHYYYKYNYGVD